MPTADVARAARDLEAFRLNRGSRERHEATRRRLALVDPALRDRRNRAALKLAHLRSISGDASRSPAALRGELAAAEKALDRLDTEIAQAMAVLDPPPSMRQKEAKAATSLPSPAEVLAAKALARGKLMVALSLTTGLVPPSATAAIRTSLRRFG